MQETQSSARQPASHLFKLAEVLGLIGLFALFIGPLVVFTPALFRGSLSGIVRAALVGFGVPASLIAVAFLLGRIAIWQEGRRA